jgi:carbon-monoxide dehydrogenase large subunit
VLQYVAVHDAGRIMHPLLAAGQVHGGIAQGIGQALLEGIVYSPEGQPLTGNRGQHLRYTSAEIK